MTFEKRITSLLGLTSEEAIDPGVMQEALEEGLLTTIGMMPNGLRHIIPGDVPEVLLVDNENTYIDDDGEEQELPELYRIVVSCEAALILLETEATRLRPLLSAGEAEGEDLTLDFERMEEALDDDDTEIASGEGSRLSLKVQAAQVGAERQRLGFEKSRVASRGLDEQRQRIERRKMVTMKALLKTHYVHVSTAVRPHYL